jgi:hypothetical protein
MKNNTITLTERHTHKISLKTFHLLIAPYPELCIKWGSFSNKTKENIFEYFLYLRNLVEIHDSDNYDNWNYWQEIFSDFISRFDEKNPYYDGNFENVVLRNERNN